ncbi:CHAT domain-containing protein [Kribbella voronezhensis]|uniref:CHAT domain-containing protein n=1 Tax=Kribbella voronezhensis TaxID=2512212 RepID=A0A4R7SYP8_9ACTN|nr:CHAT domain-containing protein [Kribbella voronezhensis]TDU84451.1 CHAT domain-containing protein [Kribbella voronezhensis]
MRSIYQSWLPPQLMAPDLFEMLSADGQIYGVCTDCGWEHRVQLVGNYTAGAVHETLRRRCEQCGGEQGLVVAPHRLRVRAECRDCNSSSWLDIEPDLARIPCPVCSSMRLTPREESVDPPFPAEFGEAGTPVYILRDDGPYVWGRSGGTDAQRLMTEAQAADLLPDPHRYRFLLIKLALRLKMTSHYDDEGRYLITQVAANLCQDYLRATGELEIGLLGLKLFGELISLAPDDLNQAIAQHSYAMGAYSLLVRWPEAYLERLAERPGLRKGAIELAQDAEQVLAGYLPQAPEQLGAHLARVRFVIGDLLRVGDSDDEQRRSALPYFDAALSDPWVGQHLAYGVAESRAHTIMTLTEPGDELIQQAADDLHKVLSTGGSDAAYRTRWRSSFHLAQLILWYAHDRVAALNQLQEAAALARQQFSAFSDERQLVYQAEQFVEVFELLATLYADFGWNDEALSAVELARGSAIRLYSMPAADRAAQLDEIEARRLEDLWPAALKDSEFPSLLERVSHRDLEADFEQNPIGPPMKALLSAHADVPTAFLSLFVSKFDLGDPVAGALLCYLSGPDEWENKRHLWRVPAADLARLNEQRYFDPGPFRDRLLRSAGTSAAQLLLEPLAGLLEESGAERVILSLPGKLARLPVEALASISGTGPSLGFTYLPSVRFGADLVQVARPGDRDLRSARVLALGYDGEDIPAQNAELASLQEIWGDQLTVVPGPECSKESVLRALAEPFDIVHAVCHGTFAETSPLDSALHFTADRYNSARSVSARDLLLRTRLAGRPLVILSACSSVVTADHRTNSFDGLAGSLFRCGARAIVGSRWPVDDRAAAVLMAIFHRLLRTTVDSPDVSLRAACRQLREDGCRAEDWAAFGYYGVI